MKKPASILRKTLVTVIGVTVLGGVFLLYSRPEMAFDAAAKLWSCL
jgi:hypothetical protein